MNKHFLTSFFLRLIGPFCCFTFLIFTCQSILAQENISDPILIKVARVFDGKNFLTDASVLIKDEKVSGIGSNLMPPNDKTRVIDLGDATLLPGFIELHAHILYRNVPQDTVLKHGITTVRDVGGPLRRPQGGKGTLRILSAGPILTAPHGYPISVMGEKNLARPVPDEKQARTIVKNLANNGAVIIKIALEPGGEAGAPWSAHHSHGHHKNNHQNDNRHNDLHHKDNHTHAHPPHSTPDHAKEWPVLSEDIVKAIVDEAHKNGLRVTAHLAEERGVEIAVNAQVDEWAHMPCNVIPEALLKKAVSQNVKIVSTIDTLSKCSGVAPNAATWKSLGGELLYGAEIAHPDIPFGIDAQELLYLKHMAGMPVLDILRSATSAAGQYLDIPMLGTLQPGAPADLIAVKGNPTHNLKILEYPDLVISGGQIVLNNF